MNKSIIGKGCILKTILVKKSIKKDYFIPSYLFNFDQFFNSQNNILLYMKKRLDLIVINWKGCCIIYF